MPVTYYPIELGDPRRQIFIVDGVVEEPAARVMHDMFRDLPVTLSDADRPDTTHIKHLKHEFGSTHWGADSVTGMLAEWARAFLLEQGIRCGEIYRIYANFNLHGDYQYAHQDGDGWTALYFVNSQWDEDWGGELILYPSIDDGIGYSVSPRPGRMVLFDGEIRHRGGVPSKLCFEARISLAIKFRRQLARTARARRN